MRKNFSEPFSKLDGCLEIFLDKLPVNQWFSIPPDRNGFELIDDISEYSNPNNIIKFSQKRFDDPIKLNNDFLSMTSNELERIAAILAGFPLDVTSPVTEEKIIIWLKDVGLSQYAPDKFAYPEFNDIDEQFY